MAADRLAEESPAREYACPSCDELFSAPKEQAIVVCPACGQTFPVAEAPYPVPILLTISGRTAPALPWMTALATSSGDEGPALAVHNSAPCCRAKRVLPAAAQ